jgi:hypothetical protein
MAAIGAIQHVIKAEASAGLRCPASELAGFLGINPNTVARDRGLCGQPVEAHRRQGVFAAMRSSRPSPTRREGFLKDGDRARLGSADDVAVGVLSGQCRVAALRETAECSSSSAPGRARFLSAGLRLSCRSVCQGCSSRPGDRAAGGDRVMGLAVTSGIFRKWSAVQGLGSPCSLLAGASRTLQRLVASARGAGGRDHATVETSHGVEHSIAAAACRTSPGSDLPGACAGAAVRRVSVLVCSSSTVSKSGPRDPLRARSSTIRALNQRYPVLNSPGATRRRGSGHDPLPARGDRVVSRPGHPHGPLRARASRRAG